MKKSGDLSELEKKIAGYYSDLEKTIKDLKSLQFSSVKELDLGSDKKAVMIFVPVPQLAEYRKIQKTLVEELEKKISTSATAGSVATIVLIVANRTMVAPTVWQKSKKFSGVRPRSRTLKSVQEALLDDLVFPSEITGKRIRVKTDGSRLLKVSLSAKESTTMESKLPTITAVYKKLMSRDIVLEQA